MCQESADDESSLCKKAGPYIIDRSFSYKRGQRVRQDASDKLPPPTRQREEVLLPSCPHQEPSTQARGWAPPQSPVSLHLMGKDEGQRNNSRVVIV